MRAASTLARRLPSLAAALVLLAAAAPAQFVNWESPHVRPLALTPDGARLLAVNTPDGRLQVWDSSGPELSPLGAVPVGLDPVSVAARTADEAWVVNRVSDSLSVVHLPSLRVLATLATDDEPADVVFAGQPPRAFVSCSGADTLLVFDPADLSAPPVRLALPIEEPRALAVAPGGERVYVASFASGNGSTLLAGGKVLSASFPPKVVNHPDTPYGGQNPPPNAGAGFDPPLAPGNPPPPDVGLIVRKDGAGAWRDDNGADWTPWVSGPSAALSGRSVGWDLPDHDVLVVETSDLSLSSIDRLMNLCMALAVNPADGTLAVVGTDARNEVRFEPVLKGRFLRVLLALAPSRGGAEVHDLNPHLQGQPPTVAPALRDLSLGDPRGAAWNRAGTRLWVTGMGSNNVVVLDAAGARAGLSPTIEVGEGPTGIVLHDGKERAYVLLRFEASLSVVSTVTEKEVARVPFFDPTPPAVHAGRRLLYDTHATSGQGQVACGSCHVDARTDRLAWDLGDPSGAMKPVGEQNTGWWLPGQGGFAAWHPMKGPMTTQTLQDIVGKEPFHWRGDRDGIEEFAGAWVSLQADDGPPSPDDLQAFEDYLATIAIPPNPFRELDNSLPTALALPGHSTTGAFGPAGEPLPPGNAQNGLQLFRPPTLLDGGALSCAACHTLPTGLGTDHTPLGAMFQPVPPGPLGERHHALVTSDISTHESLKVPHLRTLHAKAGLDLARTESRAGFGYLHDGRVDTLARFLSEPAFALTSDQEVADVVAFLLCLSGSDLPQGSPFDPQEPPGTESRDTHAAVGRQVTLDGSSSPEDLALLSQLETLAAQQRIDLVVKGVRDGLHRGWMGISGARYQSDRADEQIAAAALAAGAAPGSELTFTAVPWGSGRRFGIDRDGDGALDRDELDAGSDPADPASVPGEPQPVHVVDVSVTVQLTPGPGQAAGQRGAGPSALPKAFHARGTITVADSDGAPLAGVLVAGQWSGSTAATQQARTGGDGRAVFTSPPAGGPSPCWTLTVTGLSGEGLVHDLEADLQDSASAGAGCR